MRTVIATVGYSGLAPLAPGTAGSAVTAVLYYLLGGGLTAAQQAIMLGVVTTVAVITAGAEARARGAEDPGPVVIDEAAGYLFTVAFLPHEPWTLLAAFFLFRVFDVVKPPPARQLEKLHGGWGIVLDDVAAGIMGNLVLQAIRLWVL